MKQYKFYQAPFLAFFSRSFYSDVGLHWKGTGFAYLLLLLCICWIPGIIQLQASISDSVNKDISGLINQIPQITINKGEASIKEPQPYKIVDPDTKQVVAVIDTSGNTTSLEEAGALLLLTKTDVIAKKGDYETRSFSLKDVDHFELNKQKIKDWIELLKYVPITLYPFAVLGSFINKIIQLLICAAVGLIFVSRFKSNLSYKSLLRLSVMAASPGMIASAILNATNINIPFDSLLYFVAALAYLFLAVKTISTEEHYILGNGLPEKGLETSSQLTIDNIEDIDSEKIT